MAHDPTDWPGLCSVLLGFDCAWADVDGWHEGPCPVAQPVGATHLWAWHEDRAAVVRIGGNRLVCAELRVGQTAASGEDQIAVQVSNHDASVWADGENGISVPTQHSTFELLAAEGVSTVWFVRPR